VFPGGTEHLADAPPFAKPYGHAWVIHANVQKITCVCDAMRLPESAQNCSFSVTESDTTQRKLSILHQRWFCCRSSADDQAGDGGTEYVSHGDPLLFDDKKMDGPGVWLGKTHAARDGGRLPCMNFPDFGA
jgi:hypothetical protein